MGSEIDFEAEGLLEDLSGGEREERRRLLEELADEGVALEELRRAAIEGELPLLAVERVLTGAGPRYTAAEVAERAGLAPEFLARQWRALGMALAADADPVYSERDVEAAERIAALRDAGVPEEGILEISRVLGMTMSQLAAANRSVIGQAFGHGRSEYEVAKRLAKATETFLPTASAGLEYVLTLHLREQIRHDALARRDLARGDSAQEVSVCFADMVGFTQLGESLAPDELGAVSGRLGELAVGVVEPPVRLVKLIGDAAMFVGPEPAPVLDAALELVQSAEREGGDFPILRAGVASGRALARGGDWYGRPINLASRITDRARAGTVLASEALHDALQTQYRWSYAGRKRLKGIDEPVRVFRCRRLAGTELQS